MEGLHLAEAEVLPGSAGYSNNVQRQETFLSVDKNSSKDLSGDIFFAKIVQFSF